MRVFDVGVFTCGVTDLIGCIIFTCSLASVSPPLTSTSASLGGWRRTFTITLFRRCVVLSRRFDAWRRVERRFPLFSCVCVFARGSLTGWCKFWRWRPVGAAPRNEPKSRFVACLPVFGGVGRRGRLPRCSFYLDLAEPLFHVHLVIVADRVVERLRDRLSSGALLFVVLIFACGVCLHVSCLSRSRSCVGVGRWRRRRRPVCRSLRESCV